MITILCELAIFCQMCRLLTRDEMWHLTSVLEIHYKLNSHSINDICEISFSVQIVLSSKFIVNEENEMPYILFTFTLS